MFFGAKLLKADWRFKNQTLPMGIREASLSLILLCLLCSVILYICRGEILYRRGHLMVHISVDFELHISVDLLCGTLNGHRATKFGRFTLWHNGRRSKQPGLMQVPGVGHILQRQ